MEESRVRALRFLALQVVGAVAVVHLVVGGETLLQVLSRGLLVTYLTEHLVADPRPLLFVVSALATVGGVLAVARGRLGYRRAYGLGIALLATYVLGWVAWHTVLDHGFALGGSAVPVPDGHDHGGLVATLRSHYVEPLLATVTASTGGTPGTGRTLLGVVSTSLELVGIALLVALRRTDPAARRGGSHNPFVEEDAGVDATRGRTDADPDPDPDGDPERSGRSGRSGSD